MSQYDDAVNRLYRVKSLQAAFDERRPGSKESQFLATCVHMLEGRGYVTSNMQRWLDDLLEKGGPAEPKQEDLDLADQMAETSPHAGVSQQFMDDMITCLRSGTPLTDRQRAAVLDLHWKIKRGLEQGNVGLNPDEIRAMGLAEKVFYGYGVDYRTTCFATFKRAAAVIEKFKSQGSINRMDWTTITEAMPRMREIACPKFASGALAYYPAFSKLVVVCGLPDIDQWGRVAYNVLMDGSIKMIGSSQLKKRAPRG